MLNLFDTIIERNHHYHTKIKPELTNREREVFEAVKELGSATMHEVAKHMNRELNTISGRFGKLVEKGKLKIIGRTENRSIYKPTLGRLF
jgi:predicted HTH transcriptional regulator